MKIELKKKPKNVTIIEGFPGFGLVATITTEYLIEHLKAELIGKIIVSEVAPVVAVHNSKVIEPLGVFYVKKYNLVILHALTNVKKFEWILSEQVIQLSKMLNAKEIISIEGISSTIDKSSEVYYLAKNKNSFSRLGLNELKEGVIVGVTGALLLKDGIPFSSLFAESGTGLPDSRAAANIIKVLDKYLKLKVDYGPLIKKADLFEKKIKGIVGKSNQTLSLQEKKDLSYLG